MKKIRLDMDTFENKRALHLYLKEACHFPEHYGCNLDALYDCLSENNQFSFEIVDSEQYETYILSLIKIFRRVKCEYQVVEK